MNGQATTVMTPYENGAARESAATFPGAIGVDGAADNVVYTVQNTSTERCLQETEYGGVLTIVTTTVTRTITERVMDSEDDDSDDDVYAGNGSYLDGLHPVGGRSAGEQQGEWTHRDQRAFYRR